MVWFRNQLRMGHTVGLVLIVLISIASVGVLHVVKARTTQVTYAYAQASRGADEVRLEAERLLAATRQYVVSGGDADRRAMLDIRQRIAGALEHLETRNREASTELRALGRDLREYLGHFDATARARPGATDPDELLGKFERESSTARNSVERDLDALLATENQVLDREFARLGDLTHVAGLTIVMAGTVAFALAFLLGRRVQNKLAEQVARIERAREDARREAERRQELPSIVSHDLRSPLHAIVLSAAALEHPGHEKRAATVIASASERMKRLIDQLLDLSRIDEGGVPLDLSRFDAADAVAESARLMIPEAESRKVTLALDTEPCRVVADRERVLQILSNLTSNALKVLRDHGSIRLRVTPRDDRVRFEVIDDGPGIPPERVDKLFERHFQGPEHRRDGLGLGLYICRKLVEAQKGAIGVKSEPGHGSAFWFELPADRSIRS